MSSHEHPFDRGHRGRRGGPRPRGERIGRPGGWQQKDVPDAGDAEQWFLGRLPDTWYDGAVTVEVDREEIVVVGELSVPDSSAATVEGRIARFREDTRGDRMRIADEAEARYGRKVAWGASIGAMSSAAACARWNAGSSPGRRIAMTASAASQVSSGSGRSSTPMTRIRAASMPARTAAARSTGRSSWVPASTTSADDRSTVPYRSRGVRAMVRVLPSLSLDRTDRGGPGDAAAQGDQAPPSRLGNEKITEGPVQSDRVVQNGWRP